MPTALRQSPASPSTIAEAAATARSAAPPSPRRGASRRTASGFAAIACAAIVAAGCGAPANLPEEALFREASLSFEEEAYNTAISSYKKLLEEYPFSDKAEVASLNIAFAHYLNQAYPDALIAFNDFERLYPVSPLLPFVSYTIGMCWLDQAKAADRDPTYSEEALRQFRKVSAEFPASLYGDLARYREGQALENLAAHELYVGDWYRERKRYSAAASRYRYLLANYPNTENAGRARARIAEFAASSDAAVAAAASAPAATKPAADAMSLERGAEAAFGTVAAPANP